MRLCLASLHPPGRSDLQFGARSGKGATLEQATASACVEVAERYAAGTEFLTSADRESFKLRYMKSLYEQAPDLYLPLHAIPEADRFRIEDFLFSFSEPFSPESALVRALNEARFLWAPAYSRARDKTTYFPILWHTLKNGTTGIASGNTYEEAILHATLEVLERNALTRVALNELELPTLDLAGVTRPDLKAYIDLFAAEGIDLLAKDVSLGLSVPLVGVRFFHRRFRFADHPLFSSLNPTFIAASRPTVEDALLHCMGEYVECNLTTALARNEEVDIMLAEWEARTTRLGNRGVPMPRDLGIAFAASGTLEVMGRDLTFLERGPTLALDSVPSYADPDTCAEAEHLLSLLESHGHQVLIQDITHPVLDIPTVRVIVPELQNHGTPNQLGPAFVMSRLLTLESLIGITSPLHERVRAQHDHFVPREWATAAHTTEARERLLLYHTVATASWLTNDEHARTLAQYLEAPIATPTPGEVELIGSTEPWSFLVLFFRARNNPARALDYINAMLELKPDEAVLWAMRVHFEAQLGRDASHGKARVLALAPDFDFESFSASVDAEPPEAALAICELSCERCVPEAREACLWSEIDVATLTKRR